MQSSRRLDIDACSIHSDAPSYISDVPSYTSRDVPPYSERTGNARYSSLLPQVDARRPSAPLPSTSQPRHGRLPPIAWITPGNPRPQSRQLEAVAARRQSKSNANNAESSQPVPPKARMKRAYSTPHYSIPPVSDDFSSLHPSPSTPQAFHRSTAELFLCTCGRPNHRKAQHESLHTDVETSARRNLSVGDAPHGTVPHPQCGGDVAGSEEAIEEDDEDKTKEDPLEAEGRSWDFLIAQMGDWEERDQRWQEFRKNHEAWNKFVIKRYASGGLFGRGQI